MNVILRFIFACTSAVYGASVCDSEYKCDGCIWDQQAKRYTNCCLGFGAMIKAKNQENAVTFQLSHTGGNKTHIVFAREADPAKNILITCTTTKSNREIDLMRIALEPYDSRFIPFTSLQLDAKPSPTQAELSPFLSATLRASPQVSQYQAEVSASDFRLKYKIPTAGRNDYSLMVRAAPSVDRQNLRFLSCSLMYFMQSRSDRSGGSYNPIIAVWTQAHEDSFYSQPVYYTNHNPLVYDNGALEDGTISTENTEHVIDIRRNEYFLFNQAFNVTEFL